MQNKALPETQSELLQRRGEPPELEPTDKLDTLMAKRRLEDWEQSVQYKRTDEEKATLAGSMRYFFTTVGLSTGCLLGMYIGWRRCKKKSANVTPGKIFLPTAAFGVLGSLTFGYFDWYYNEVKSFNRALTLPNESILGNQAYISLYEVSPVHPLLFYYYRFPALRLTNPVESEEERQKLKSIQRTQSRKIYEIQDDLQRKIEEQVLEEEEEQSQQQQQLEQQQSLTPTPTTTTNNDNNNTNTSSAYALSPSVLRQLKEIDNIEEKKRHQQQQQKQ